MYELHRALFYLTNQPWRWESMEEIINDKSGQLSFESIDYYRNCLVTKTHVKKCIAKSDLDSLEKATATGHNLNVGSFYESYMEELDLLGILYIESETHFRLVAEAHRGNGDIEEIVFNTVIDDSWELGPNRWYCQEFVPTEKQKLDEWYIKIYP